MLWAQHKFFIWKGCLVNLQVFIALFLLPQTPSSIPAGCLFATIWLIFVQFESAGLDDWCFSVLTRSFKGHKHFKTQFTKTYLEIFSMNKNHFAWVSFCTNEEIMLMYWFVNCIIFCSFNFVTNVQFRQKPLSYDFWTSRLIIHTKCHRVKMKHFSWQNLVFYYDYWERWSLYDYVNQKVHLVAMMQISL